MNRSLALLLCTAGASLTITAQAAMAVRAADLPATNNGSTGYVGLSASVGTRADRIHARSAMSTTPGGELTTLQQGRPNVATDAPASASHPHAMDTATMGARATASVNPASGTPD